MPNSSEEYMKEAIAEGQRGMEAGHGGPFGALVVQERPEGGRIVGRGHNRVLIDNDPTAHAEVVAIRAATAALGHFELKDCVLYTSCEPCPMCLGAIYWARLAKVYFGATREDAAAAGFDDLHIYNELPLPVEQRALPFESVGRHLAVPAFEQWRNKNDKTPY